MKKRIILVVLMIILAGIVGYFSFHQAASIASKDKENANPASSRSSEDSAKTSNFDKKKYSLTDPTSIWVIVNKKRPLKPQDYAPSDLVTPELPLRVPGNESMQMRKVTAEALTKMFTDAKTDNARMMVSSGYRPYAYQVSLYNKYVKDQGQAVADTQSARPGFSEHQTGLAVDVEPYDQQCDVDQCFADTPAGKWLAGNAYKYGFIIRYPKDETATTGYTYEPWHIRYVGIELATEMHKTGIANLEDFFGLPKAPDY